MAVTNKENKKQPHDIDNQSIIKRFNKLNKSLRTIQKDISILFKFLSPALELNIRNNVITETLIEDRDKYFKKNKPSLILMLGNNDLTQVEYVAKLLRSWGATVPIIISGLGGHGTILGPISKYSEAATFKRKLEECGIKNPILIDEYATNTGQNITNSEILLKELAAQSNKDFPIIFISGSFSSALRQIRSFAKQSKLTHWKKLFILPPTQAQLTEKYFASYLDATVNLFGLLREVLTLIDYMTNKDYVLIKQFSDKEAFLNAHAITFEYLSKLLNNPKLTELAELRAKQLMLYIELRELGSNSAVLKNLLTQFYNPLVAYIRICFDFLERETMNNLANKESIQDLHRQSLFFSKTYAKIGVDPVPVPTNHRHRPK